MSQALNITTTLLSFQYSYTYQTKVNPFDLEMITISKSDYIQLTCEIKYWKSQHGRAVEREAVLKVKLAASEAKNKDLNHRIFGKSSEKQTTTRSDAEFTGEKPTGKPRGQQRGSEGHGRTPRKNLLVKEKSVDLPDDEKKCPSCDKPFNDCFGTEDSDYIEIVVKSYIRRLKRKRYTPGCNCKDLPGIITAPMEPRLLNRNQLGISIWTDVLLDKFLYYTPTHRLLQKYQRLGLPISQGTITDGLKRIGPMLEPVTEAIHAKQMTESMFCGDETRWKVFEAVDGKTNNRWWIWIVISDSAVHYRLAPGRNAEIPIEHFEKLDPSIVEAIFLCDRFSSYKKMANTIAAIILAFCWAHVRRDFIKAARSHPDEKEWMLDWVWMIRDIYRINRKRSKFYNKSKSLKKQSRAFKKQHKALKKAMCELAKKRGAYLAREEISAPQKAVLTSLKNHWDGLTVFVKYPYVPMDNNISERGVRKPALLRNSVHGSGSQWSGLLMANMMSILQTLIMWKINPHTWLQEFLQACANNGRECPEDLSPFLPWQMDDERKAFLQQARAPNNS